MLAGSTVLVVGAGRGLGREVAAAALREGANVMLGARTEATIATIADELDPAGTQVAWRPTDIRLTDQCEALAQACIERFGRLDAVVTCAVAGDALLGGIQHADLDDWRQLFEVNLFATMQMVSSSVNRMTDGGSIVLIGSQAAYHPNVVQAGYAASKAALLGASAHLAAELGPRSIRVNVVAPGWMRGPSLEQNVHEASGGDPSTLLDKIARKLPLRSMAEDGDVAEAALFLASSRAKAITGQCLLVNAGEYSR